eukprot:TRINITY_DN4791_c0_g1_i1.p1 TRINITY_DN4791_c0_g1~~TRINITY_DN4791_c0_g1_i1.p1  ORF type:complete len:225 (-),score=49.59 TRINITY_DN4791_c0_g1_i1:755-1429(-)
MEVSKDFIDLLGHAATFFTFLLFISGVTVCLVIGKAKSTGDRSSITFISGALMCYVWYAYGVSVKDSNVSFINLVGCIIHVAYSIFFIYYCPATKRRPVKIQLLVSFGLVGLLYMIQSFLKPEEKVIQYTGLLGSFLSIVFAASPLVSLKHVFKNKSTEILPFYTILAVFIVGALWFLYGLLKGDPFLIFTNGANGFLSLLQLSLFVAYPSKSSSYKDIKESVI